jgi:hypothetical protein
MFLVEAVKKGQVLPTELPTELVNSVYRGNQAPLSPSFQLTKKQSTVPVTERPKSLTPETTQVDFRGVLKKSPVPPRQAAEPASGRPPTATTTTTTAQPSARNSLPVPQIQVDIPVDIPSKFDIEKEEEALRREEEELKRQEEQLLRELAEREQELNNLGNPPPNPTSSESDFDYIRPPSPPPEYDN